MPIRTAWGTVVITGAMLYAGLMIARGFYNSYQEGQRRKRQDSLFRGMDQAMSRPQQEQAQPEPGNGDQTP